MERVLLKGGREGEKGGRIESNTGEEEGRKEH